MEVDYEPGDRITRIKRVGHAIAVCTHDAAGVWDGQGLT